MNAYITDADPFTPPGEGPLPPARFVGDLSGTVWYEVDGKRVELGVLGYFWWQDQAERRDLARDMLGRIFGDRVGQQLERPFATDVVSTFSAMGFSFTVDQLRQWYADRR